MAQINKPDEYFNTKLYTGNGGTNNITGVNFQPDFVWLKLRDAPGSHRLVDSVRGATKALRSNQTNAENTDAGLVQSFDSDGFTHNSADTAFNGNGDPYASWNWLGANGTASNTDGDITSTVSANTTSGFSIVSWTGNGNLATIGHGLGVTPSMYIVKNRSIVESWIVYHKGLTINNDPPEDLHLILDSTDAVANYPVWNDTAPTSSVFTVNNYAGTNGNTNNMLAYCFAEVKGFSKFGSYVGNGSTDGAFVYTGFKPAFIIVKRTDSTSSWDLYDNKRLGYNVNNYGLFPDLSNAESTTDKIDILSNGFKMRTTTGGNYSGASYIYMAFAEEPLVGDNPATAR